MIFFDIDGVVRSLFLDGREPDIWMQRNENGHTICDRIYSDLSILENAPELPGYVEVCRYLSSHVIMLSHQPDVWRPYTNRWMAKHLPSIRKSIYVKDAEQKVDYLEAFRDSVLVDDSPLLPVHDRIILVDRKYNRHINSLSRVRSPLELVISINKKLGFTLLKRFLEKTEGGR